jgi:hypothetical protein
VNGLGPAELDTSVILWGWNTFQTPCDFSSILRYKGPLLGGDRHIDCCTAAVTGQCIAKQKLQRKGGTVVSVQSALRWYKRRNSIWCKIASKLEALLLEQWVRVGRSPVGMDVNIEAEAICADTAEPEDLARAVINCGVCQFVIAL